MPKIYGYTEILGDILITGSFSILGSASTINTTNLTVSDTIITLGHSQSGPLLDEGIMFARGTGLTQALIWDESEDTFAFIGTNDDHTVIGDVNINSYSNLRVGGLTASSIKIPTGASAGYVLTSIDNDGNTKWSPLGSDSNELDPVISFLGTPPVSPTVGDRYLISGGSGIWTGLDNQIAEHIGPGINDWTYYTPSTDDVIFVTDTLTTYRYNGSSWIAWLGTAILQNGNSLSTAVNIGTNNSQNLQFKTNNQNRFTIDSTGNIGVGSSPTSSVRFNISSSTSSSTSFRILGTNSKELFTISNTGTINQNHPLSTVTHSIVMSSSNAISFISNVGPYLTVGPTNNIDFGGQRINASGRVGSLGLSTTVILPSVLNISSWTYQTQGVADSPDLGIRSGAVNISGILMNPTLNNSGTYSGTYRGFYYNPTIHASHSSSTTRHIAIETVTGDVLLASSTGSVGIGLTSPSYKLQVTGTISTTGFRMTNGSSNGFVLSSDSDGVGSWTASYRDILFHHSTSGAVGDSLTYHVGFIYEAPTTTNLVTRRVRSVYRGEIVSVNLVTMIGSTLATGGENVIYEIHNLTQATYSTITNTGQLNSTDQINTYVLSSNLTVSEGDELQFRWITPVFSVNPSSVRHVLTAKLRVY
jgi:hypothetical protein